MKQAISCLLLLAPLVAAVWPAPNGFFTQGRHMVRLAPSFTIQLSSGLNKTAPLDLLEAVREAQGYVDTDSHYILTPDRGASYRPEVLSAPVLTTLELRLSWASTAWLKSSIKGLTDSGATAPSIASEVNKPIDSRDESYGLHIPPSPSKNLPATITASTTLGLLRGLQSFTQLIYTLPPIRSSGMDLISGNAEEDINVRYVMTPVTIKDRPANVYRGILIDTSRHFYSIKSLKRLVDAMSWAKLNTLHWHAVDSVSWPLFISSHPQLVNVASYSSFETYSLSDVQDFVKYASSHGVSVLVELDTPGHTAILAEFIPDLIACSNMDEWWKYSKFSAGPPAGQLRIADPASAEFVAEMYRSVADVFPSPLFSSGGDEIEKICYEQDSVTQAQLTARNMTLDQALSDFVTHTHDALRKKGKTPVVWEEMVLDHDVALGSDTIVSVWQSSENVKKVASKGFKIIQSASDYAYLDCGAGSWLGNNPDGRSWCDPYKTWQRIYSWDPLANLTQSEKKLVIGGQTLLWSEQADEQNMDSLIWPRSLAAAEIFWTGETGDLEDALPRIHDMRYRMVQRGIRAGPIQPQWCALRPGHCNAQPRNNEGEEGSRLRIQN